MPAAALEKLVVERTAAVLGNPSALAPLLLEQTGDIQQPLARAGALAAKLAEADQAELHRLFGEIIAGVAVGPNETRIRLVGSALAAPSEHPLSIEIAVEARLERGSGGLTLLLNGAQQAENMGAMVRAIAQGRSWFDALVAGRATSMVELAKSEGVTLSYVRNNIRLALVPAATIEAALAV